MPLLSLVTPSRILASISSLPMALDAAASCLSSSSSRRIPLMTDPSNSPVPSMTSLKLSPRIHRSTTGIKFGLNFSRYSSTLMGSLLSADTSAVILATSLIWSNPLASSGCRSTWSSIFSSKHSALNVATMWSASIVWKVFLKSSSVTTSSSVVVISHATRPLSVTTPSLSTYCSRLSTLRMARRSSFMTRYRWPASSVSRPRTCSSRSRRSRYLSSSLSRRGWLCSGWLAMSLSHCFSLSMVGWSVMPSSPISLMGSSSGGEPSKRSRIFSIVIFA
mmetsp:Transcript_30459/g.88544  ORF Transcript_30459/g.88544 Transcript_30459/m.88544 type:complete len:277 (+) Transcript_30459:1527-2357(+)